MNVKFYGLLTTLFFILAAVNGAIASFYNIRFLVIVTLILACLYFIYSLKWALAKGYSWFTVGLCLIPFIYIPLLFLLPTNLFDEHKKINNALTVIGVIFLLGFLTRIIQTFSSEPKHVGPPPGFVPIEGRDLLAHEPNPLMQYLSKSRKLENWRKLKRGMTENQVRSILGEPVRIAGGVLTFWYYRSGEVIFQLEKLDSWREPFFD
jgi:hypothetical protein